MPCPHNHIVNGRTLRVKSQKYRFLKIMDRRTYLISVFEDTLAY